MTETDYQCWCAESGEERAWKSIAEVDLMAAAGLPRAERLDVGAHLETIDEWAGLVDDALSARGRGTASSAI